MGKFEIISCDQRDLAAKLPPIIKKTSSDLDCINSEEVRIFSAVNLKIGRRRRVFVNKHWQDKFIKWKGGKLEQFDSVRIINVPYDFSYCHNLIDTLPLILKHESIEKQELVIIAGSEYLNKFIKELNLKFRNVFVLNNSVDFKTKKLEIENYCMLNRSTEDIKRFRGFINRYKKNILKLKPAQGKNLIYCTRNSGGGAKNGRLMNSDNEFEIRKELKCYAEEKGLKFFVFNGKINGKPASINAQIKIFHEAKMIIGPHGGAMSNSIYLDEQNKCSVCEFVSGLDYEESKIQAKQAFVKNYNRIYNNTISEYSDYYLIPFQKGSLANETKIDLKNLKKFLNIV